MREAPSVPLINSLINAGAEVNAYDPQAINEAKFYLKGLDVKYYDNKYNALENVDALILVTEWKEFRSPDFKRILNLMNTNVFIDGRNQFNYNQMKEQGFNYSQIGVK
jgi:UDPglucose 6-dehydrogenase